MKSRPTTAGRGWARQGSEAVSIDRLKPFQAMYVDALEHHCPPDPKADLKMLGDEFAEFIDSNLDEEIDAGPPAQQQWPAGARQAPPPAAAGAAAAAADPPPFGQLEHAAHPVPPAVFKNEEDAPYAPQMRLGQRQAGRGQRQIRMDAEAANGQYWDANREKDRERSQSNPLRQRHNLEWCRQREDLDQEYIHNVLRTGLLKEGGGDGVPFTASPAVGIKNLHVMLTGKPLTFYLVVMLLTFIIGQGMDGTSTYRALLVQHC
jgi:hypothetical protein